MRFDTQPMLSLTLPSNAAPNDPAIILGQAVPPCMETEFSSVILFRPANSQIGPAATNDSPYYFIAQRRLIGPNTQYVEEGFVLYDPNIPFCQYATITRKTGVVVAGPQITVAEEWGIIAAGALAVSGTPVLQTNSSVLDVNSQLIVSGNINWRDFSGTNDITNGQVSDVSSRTTTSTSYTAITGGGAPVMGIVFYAPTSGRVFINIGHLASNSLVTDTSRTSFELRTGTSIGAGTVIQAASDNYTIFGQPGVNGESIGRGWFAPDVGTTPLTPGSAYNVQLMHRVTAGTGTFVRRILSVEPGF